MISGYGSQYEGEVLKQGHPTSNVNFRKISVQKMILDVEFSENFL